MKKSTVIILLSILVLIIISIIYISINKKQCEFSQNEIGERNVILRVDDIQAHAWFDSQKIIIEDADKRDIPLVLGVIPFNLKDDKRIWKLLNNKKCHMEIALHGYAHSDGEFANLNYEEAYNKIIKGLNILNKIQKEIITFLPPQDLYSDNTKKALNDLRFNFISARNQNHNDYGYTQTMYDWDEHKLNDYNKVIGSCNKTLEDSNLCIIVIHPQDFVTEGKLDKEKYENYLGLLDNLDELDANIITFRDLLGKNIS